MDGFDAEKFAEWLTSQFENSHYKSWSDLAKKVGVSRVTIGSYANARIQTLSGQPSRPRRDVAIRIAEAFDQPPNEVLLLTGHSPAILSEGESIFELGDMVHLIITNPDFTEEEKQAIAEVQKLVYELTMIRRQKFLNRQIEQTLIEDNGLNLYPVASMGILKADSFHKKNDKTKIKKS